MSLELLKNIAEKEQLPDWVSRKNKSCEIYKAINDLAENKSLYIKQHRLAKDYKRKKLFQITASEVSRLVGLAVPTITSTSTYSTNVREYLKSINNQLISAKNKRIKAYRKSSTVHSQRKKKEILSEFKKAKREIAMLKKQNSNEQVDILIKNLSLPVKRKLGLG